MAQQAQAQEHANTLGINAVYEAAVAAKDYSAQVLMHWFINEQVEEEDWSTEMVERVQTASCAGSLSDLDRHIERYLEEEVREVSGGKIVSGCRTSYFRRFSKSVQPVAQAHDRVFPNHARPGITHHHLDLFAADFLIAMNGALGTRRLFFTEPAAFQSHVGIIQQPLTFRT